MSTDLKTFLSRITNVQGTSAYFYDDGFPRPALFEDAKNLAALAVPEAAQEDYREGVNIKRLADALLFLGIAGCGQEEMAARMSEYINHMTLGVMRLKESMAPKAPAASQEVSDAGIPISALANPELPRVPSHIVEAISRYGDDRADEKTTNSLSVLIRLIREALAARASEGKEQAK